MSKSEFCEIKCHFLCFPTFEEFIAECDEDMNIMHTFKIFLSKEYEKQAMFYNDIDNQSDKKKH